MQGIRWKQLFTVTLLMAVTALWVPDATAQLGTMDDDGSPVKIGVRGGLTQATLYGDDVEDAGFRPGFTGGAYLTYRVNEALSVQPEVLYSVRGAKNVDYNLPTAVVEDDRVRHDVLQVPVLFKLSAPLEPVTPRLYAGPAVGFLLNSEIDGQDADDTFTSVDFGGVVGGELALDLNQQTGGVVDEIALDGRYNVGFVDLGDTAGIEALRTSAFTGTLSLRFNI